MENTALTVRKENGQMIMDMEGFRFPLYFVDPGTISIPQTQSALKRELFWKSDVYSKTEWVLGLADIAQLLGKETSSLFRHARRVCVEFDLHIGGEVLFGQMGRNLYGFTRNALKKMIQAMGSSLTETHGRSLRAVLQAWKQENKRLRKISGKLAPKRRLTRLEPPKKKAVLDTGKEKVPLLIVTYQDPRGRFTLEHRVVS